VVPYGYCNRAGLCFLRALGRSKRPSPTPEKPPSRGRAPCSANYSPCSGGFPGLNNIVYPRLPHIMGTTAVPSTGAPSAVEGSGVEMSTCSGPTENRPREQTGHPRKPLDVRDFSIRSDLCCWASEAMLLPLRVRRRFFACYMAEPSAILGRAGVVRTFTLRGFWEVRAGSGSHLFADVPLPARFVRCPQLGHLRVSPEPGPSLCLGPTP